MGELDWYRPKNGAKPPTHTIHQNKLMMDERLKNISCDTIKVLEEIIDSNISDIPYSNIFTDISPRAREIKEKINNWDYIKVNCFCTAKETIIKMKRELIVFGRTYLPMLHWTRV